MKKTILLLCLICEVGFSQQIIFQSNGKLYKRVTTTVGAFVDSEYVVTATAVVDTTAGHIETQTMAALKANSTDVLKNADSTANRTYSDSKYAPISRFSGYVTVKNTADTTKSTTALVSPTNLKFAVVSGTYYHFKFILVYTAAATTTALKVALVSPTVTVMSAGVSNFGQAADGTAGEWVGTINSSGDVVTSTATVVINVPYICIVEGIILPSANGNLQLQWAPGAAAAMTLKNGTMGELWTY